MTEMVYGSMPARATEPVVSRWWRTIDKWSLTAILVLFGTPAILGIPAGIFTVTTKIYTFFQFPPQPELAATVSLPMLVMTIFLLQSREWLLGRRSYTLIGGKSSAICLSKSSFDERISGT